MPNIVRLTVASGFVTALLAIGARPAGATTLASPTKAWEPANTAGHSGA